MNNTEHKNELQQMLRLIPLTNRGGRRDTRPAQRHKTEERLNYLNGTSTGI